ncbi:MAG: hypothetical protein AAF191_08960 [Verrucomicrobiota bacterium]
MERSENAPVFKLQLGRVKVAVFRREHEGRVFYSSKISESYRDSQTGDWKETSSFQSGELGNVAKLAQAAQDWILKQQLKSQS